MMHMHKLTNYLSIYAKVFIYNGAKVVYIKHAGRKGAQCVSFATFFIVYFRNVPQC